MNSAVLAGRPRGGISLPFLVAALIAGHAISSMALLVLPAVAPAVAREYGVDASLIGYQISLVTAGMLASLAMLGNLSRKLGGARTNQLGHVMVATGMLLMLAPSASFLIAGSLVVGVGYGLLTPSASYLLMRFTPDARRNFVFSVHQAAIPLGGILAAVGAPWVAVTVGWRWAVALNALLLFAVVALMQRERAGWDDDRNPAHRAVSPTPFTGVAGIWRVRGLRLISVAGGCLCWVQFCVSSFTVVACVEMLGMNLVAAGTVLLAVQLGSTAGRLLAGAIADAVGNAKRVLAGIAGLAAATCIASAWLAPAWPLPLVYALFALLGMTSGGWGGILFGEVGRLAPPGQVSMTFSGSLVYINFGKFVGTIVFANVYAFSRSYGFAFATVAVPALIALYCLLADKK
ncbi:MAG: MFS transporter [Pseudomonadota bacterium]